MIVSVETGDNKSRTRNLMIVVDIHFILCEDHSRAAARRINVQDAAQRCDRGLQSSRSIRSTSDLLRSLTSLPLV